MRILITNDDGIGAEGIAVLARLAKRLGEVTVAAPAAQCSAQSQHISINDYMTVRRAAFPVPGVTAYSVDGTPADAVMTALCSLMEEPPDYVFSGINDGYNTGLDILYSGTVGAAMESLVHGVPAIAFSLGPGAADFSVVEENFDEVVRELLKKPCGPGEIYNINFPACPPERLKGILYDRAPAKVEFYSLYHYSREEDEDGTIRLSNKIKFPTEGPAGTDMGAVLEDCISVGKVRNMVL